MGQEHDVSQICERCIKEINAKDLSEEQVEVLLREFAPRGIAFYAKKFLVCVAFTASGRVCGTGTLAGKQIKGVFVDPGSIGKGIGRQIMTFLENEARKRGEKIVCLNSSKYAAAFYAKIGYKKVGIVNSSVGRMIRMEKKIEKIQHFL